MLHVNILSIACRWVYGDDDDDDEALQNIERKHVPYDNHMMSNIIGCSG